MTRHHDPQALTSLVHQLTASEAQAPVNAPAVDAAAAGLPDNTINWAVSVSHVCTQTVSRMMGEPVAAMLSHDASRAIEASVVSFLRYLAGGDEPLKLNDDQILVAHRMARLDLPYEEFVKGLRCVQDIVFESLLDQAERYGPERARPSLLRTLTAKSARFHDESVAAAVMEYVAERQRMIVQRLSGRRRVAIALIAGEYIPEDTASRILGIELVHQHLALVLWPPDHQSMSRVQQDFERAVTQAANSLRAAGTLSIPDEADGALFTWITRPTPFPADYVGILAAVFDPAGGIMAAVGPPAPGPAGFRRSHLGARDAHVLAQRRRPAKVTAYREVGILALLAADPDRAQWFVSEELQGLGLSGDAGLAELRETALRYLDSGCSPVRTAAAMHLHRNTVIYRVANIERLLGRPLSDRMLATHAALTLAIELHDLMPG